MTPNRLRQWVALLLFALSTTAARRIPPSHDFVCTRVLADGEVERRIRRGRVSAIETTVEIPAADPDPAGAPTDSSFPSSAGGKTSDGRVVLLTLLQVTDGRHFIQLIYDSGWELRDCEYLKSAKSVDDFYDAFAAAADVSSGCPRNDSAATVSVDPRRPDITDYAGLRRECKNLHRRVKEMKFHPGLQQKRLKRDLFLYPGTNWCGSGSNARKFNELGYNAAADRCCRDHDHCPYTIEGFTNKFNFFNFRFHTISHCDCDERFRACLKLSSTAAGNMVGKLFFNVVQTKCFLFQNIKKCAKRSWWGKCLKFEKEKSAFLREALKY